MTKIVVATRSWQDAAALEAATKQASADIQILSVPSTAQQAFDDATTMGADLVLLSPLIAGYQASLISDLLYYQERPIVAIGLLPSGGGDYESEMLAAGMKSRVNSPLDNSQIRVLLERIPQAVQEAKSERAAASYVPLVHEQLMTIADSGWRARTVAVWSPKGGEGKTFTAVNLAVALGVLGKRRTILIDADMSRANCHVYLQIPETRNIFGLYAEAVGKFQRTGRIEISPNLVKTYVAHYGSEQASKLDVLVGIPKMHMAGMPEFREDDKRTMDIFRELLQVTETMQYDFRVIDLGPDFNMPLHWVGLERADPVLLVVSPQLTSINDVKNALPALKQAFGSLGRFQLIINRFHEAFGISEADIVGVLGMTKYGTIPADDGRQCMVSLNTNKPVVLEAPTEVSDGLMTIARTLYPPLEPIWLQRGGKVGKQSKRTDPQRGGKSILGRVRGVFATE